MAKKKKRVNSHTVAKVKTDKLNNILNGKYKHYIFISLLFIIISLMFFKVAFLGYVPKAQDTQQWRSSANAVMEYNKTHSDKAFWDTNIFSGMPAYFISFTAKYPFIAKLRTITGHFMNWRIFLMFMGALGVYFLMIFWKFEPIYAFIAAFAFAVSADFIGLIEIGHNTKFRAIMYIPWIFLALEIMRKRKDVLSIGLFSVFMIGQLRESHPQISYYTILMIGIYWILHLIWGIKDKKIKEFSVFTGIMIISFIIVMLAVSNPYMNKVEYGKYSMRGGKSGLTKDYATSWSFHPLEILTFINPGFFGETSPHYWGWMPFTQTSPYMGIIVLFLAVIAMIYIRERRVIVLMTVSIFALLLSFGRHFPLLTNFMLDYFPAYNKFRVPATILILLQFAVAILAVWGLKFIISKRGDAKYIKHFKNYMIAAVILFVLMMVLPSMMSHGFVKTGDASKYSRATVKMLIQERKDIFINDGITSTLFLLAFVVAAYWFLMKKMKKSIFLILSLILVVGDISIMDKKFLTNIEPKNEVLQNKKTKADKFLLQDKSIYRIYPLGRDFGNNKWTYFHQSIGGYHGAKLKRYNNILQKCLNSKKYDRNIPINWNIVNMLNAKYLIFDRQLPIPNLQLVYHDEKEKKFVYKNNSYLKRAWFVKNLILLKDENKILSKLNSKSFNPAESAIVEDKIPEFAFDKNVASIKADSSFVKLTKFDANNLAFDVKADSTGFMVMSEIYYPAGWKAFVDGKETKIYQVNYILRGIVVPKGAHKVEMKFISDTYNLTAKLSLVGLLSSILLLIVGAVIWFIKRKKK